MKEELKIALDAIKKDYESISEKLTQLEVVSNYETCQEYSKKKALYQPAIDMAQRIEKKEQ
ncbi:MAG: hypothetical protein PHQ54_05090, partial [Candidatus Omnitrophica bacterium]|nr:hypothetical protein [Candidatus Omnitrophota bacterium]